MGLKLKIVLRAGPGREKKQRIGPGRKIVVLPSLVCTLSTRTVRVHT